MADEHHIKIDVKMTPVVDKQEIKSAAEDVQSTAQETFDKNGIEITPVVKAEDVKKAVDDVKNTVKDITDIEIAPKIDTSSVVATSGELRGIIQQIFDASAGDQLNSRFQALHDRMEKVRQKSVEVETELQRLAEESGTVYTKEYDKLTKQQADIIKQIERLKAEQAKIIRESPVTEEGESLGPYLPSYKKLEKELEGLRERNKSLIGQIRDLKEQGLDTLTVEETTEYKKLVTQQEELNNKMRIYVLQWNEARDKMAKASNQSEDTGENMTGNISGANKAIFGLSGSLRGIARLIPGISSTAITSIAMVARSVTRLSSLTKEQLLGALNTVAESLRKLVATILSNPALFALTAILVTLTTIVKITKDIKKEFEWVEKILKRIASTLTGVFKKAISSIAKSAISLVAGAIKLVTNGIKSIISKIKSLKEIITEYLKIMAQWNDGNNDVNRALSNLTSSLTYVKAALAAAFAPILTVVEPTLTRFANQLGDTINLLGMFIAKLTGATTYQKAVRQQKDYAQSLSKVSKAAKEASKSLASYDKLQVINQQHAEDATGANESGVDWEEVALSDFQLPDWLTNLYELGQKAGTKIRDMLQSIPWDTVTEGSIKAAKGVSDLINGFFSIEDLGSTVGSSLASAGNAIVIFFNTILNETQWGSIGIQIGQAIATALKEFSFGELGKTISGLINAIFSLLYGALTQFSGEDIGKALTEFLLGVLDIDWGKVKLTVSILAETFGKLLETLFTENNIKEVSKAAKKLIETIFVGLKKFNESVDLGEIGSSIASGVNDLISGIQWEDNSKIVNDLALGILSLFTHAIQEVDWAVLAQDIAKFLDGVDWATIADSLKGLSEALRNAVQSLWKELEANGVWEEWIDIVGDVLAEKKNWEKLFKKIKASVIRELVLNKIWEIITAFPKRWWKRMVESFEIFKESGGFFADIADAIKEQDWGRIGEDIINGIFAGIIGFVDLALTLANITPVLDIIKDAFCELFGIHSPATEMEFIGENIVLGIFEGFSLVDFAGKLSEWWDNNVAPWFTYERWKELGENMNSAMSDRAEELKTSLSEKFVSIKDKIVEIFTTMKESLKVPINGVISVVESFVNTLITGINSLLSKFNTIGFDFTNPFSGVTTSFGFDLPQLSQVTLPRLAQGGVIPPNKEFAAILGDQKSGVNIETPLDTMVQAFKQAISETGGIHDPIILQLNGKTVAQVVWDEEAKRYKQTGRYQYT